MIDQYACSKLDTIENRTAQVRNLVSGFEQSVAPLVNAGITAVDAAVDVLLPTEEKDKSEKDNQEDAAAATDAADAPEYVVGAETAKAVRRIRSVSSKTQARVYEKALGNIRNAHARSTDAIHALRPYTIDLIAYDTGSSLQDVFPVTQQLLGAVKAVKTKSLSLLDETGIQQRAQGALALATDATGKAFLAISATQDVLSNARTSAKARANAAVAFARSQVDKAIAIISESKTACVDGASSLTAEQVTAALVTYLEQANDLRLQLQSLTKDDVLNSAVGIRDEVYEYLVQLRNANASSGTAEPAAIAEPVSTAEESGELNVDEAKAEPSTDETTVETPVTRTRTLSGCAVETPAAVVAGLEVTEAATPAAVVTGEAATPATKVSFVMGASDVSDEE